MTIVEIISNLPLPILNHWGYWIILLGSIFEANPITGLFVPGMTIVILGGFFAKLGIINLGGVIFFAVLGAIIGDFTGYFLGRIYGHSFLLKYGKYFLFKKEYYEKTREVIENHTGKAIIIGRFNSLTRAFAPFVAGATEIPVLKFSFYNIIGGFLWGTFFVLVGYIFGASYKVFSKYIGISTIILLVLIFAFIYFRRLLKKSNIKINKSFIYLAILNVLSLYIFSKMLEDFVDKESTYGFDLLINQKITLLWTPLLNKIILFLTSWMGIALFIGVILTLSILIYKRKKEYSGILLFSLFFGFLTEQLFKNLIQRVRPENQLISDMEYSFPSGHATMAMILFGFLIFAYRKDIKNYILRHSFVMLNLILILFVGFSRIYLNTHWFSDVIAGYTIGLFWLTFFILIFEIGQVKKIIFSYSDKSLRKITNMMSNK